MGKPVYVIGHRNPDTDSICSAIAYAYMKNALGEPVLAARAGKINAETKYVLEYFQTPAPFLIHDLYPRVKDVMQTGMVAVKPNDTLQELGQIIKKHKVKSVPVVDNDQMLVGIVTVGDLAERYINELEMQDLREAGVNYAGIVRCTGGMLLCGGDLQRNVIGKVKIAAAQVDTMSQMIEPGDIVLVGDREDAQLACIEHKAACLVVTGGAQVSAAVCQTAQEQGVYVITVPHDTFTSARLINQSIPVHQAMKSNVIAFKPDQLVADSKKTMSGSSYRYYPVVDNGKLVGLLSRDQLIVPEREQVILVDHNERSQAVEGIEEARIIEIVDHHRLGGLQTGEPIFIRHEPVGSTATIVANMFWHRGIPMSSQIAGLLLAAIVSDTVLFKSPTATAKDRETADKLAIMAGLDLQEFGMAVLKAGSATTALSVNEILATDMKEFEIGEHYTAISQISVMDPQPIMAMRAEILVCLEKMARQEQYDMFVLLITDILQEITYLLYWGEPSGLLWQAFGPPAEDGIFYLPGVMSRKKQVVPPMIEASRKLANDR